MLLLLCYAAFTVLTGLDHPIRGDEGHFIETARFFGTGGIASALKDYGEITPPLSFVLFGLWGRLFGFSPGTLRVLSIMMGFLTLVLLYVLYLRLSGGLKHAVTGMLVLLLNPYLSGLSVHVFTDIPQLLTVTIAVIALLDRRPLPLFVALSLSLLARQYSLCFVVAFVLWLAVKGSLKERRGRRLLAAVLLSTLPLLGLFAVWGGPAPPSGLRLWVVDDGSFYRIGFIYTYVMFLALYSLPLLPLVRRMLFDKRNAIPAVILSLGTLLFPVVPSAATALQTDFSTVGLAHRAITAVLGSGALFSVIQFILSWAGFSAITGLIRRDMGTGRDNVNEATLLTLMTVSFLLLMPVSFQVWEKYLVMVQPFFVLRLLMEWRREPVNTA